LSGALTATAPEQDSRVAGKPILEIIGLFDQFVFEKLEVL
jgi:hypothetical protein